jgi:hypothetical protein
MIPLAILALLTLQDPANDALGDGSLSPPTAAIHGSIDPYDIREFAVLAEDTLAFSVTMGSLSNPLDLPYGFSFPIIEVYFGDGESGATQLLPGSGMRLDDAGWRYAFRLTGDGLRLYTADLQGEVTDITSTTTLEFSTLGNTITVRTPLLRPEILTIYAITGMYSPFSITGWQPLSREPAPWAFSGDADYPVLDVLSSTREGQQSALATGILSTIRSEPVREPWNPWLTVMLGGVAIAFIGVGGRMVAGRKAGRAGAVPVTEIAPEADDVSELLPDDTSEVILLEEALLTAEPEEPTPLEAEEPSAQPVVPITDTPLPGLEPPPSVLPPLLPEPDITVTPEAPKRLSLDATQWEEEDPDLPLWDDETSGQVLSQEPEKK